MRQIQKMSAVYLQRSLDFVEQVFTEYCNEKEGKMVRALVEEIRSKKYYLPELELIMVEGDTGEIIGYAMFSRFQLAGRQEEGILILTPVAVKTALQRQHISKELLEYGFERSVELGYKAVLVEGNPRNYHARGFETAAVHGILAGHSVHLPSPECLMVRELMPGALEDIQGYVEYEMYDTLMDE